MALIERNMVFVDDHWEVRYPWIKDPHQLPNNVYLAYKRLQQTEKRLMRDLSWMQTYNDRMADMLERGVARKLTQKEMVEHKGPIHYITHHAVLKEDSATTPARIVFDCSANYKRPCIERLLGEGS